MRITTRWSCPSAVIVSAAYSRRTRHYRSCSRSERESSRWTGSDVPELTRPSVGLLVAKQLCSPAPAMAQFDQPEAWNALRVLVARPRPGMGGSARSPASTRKREQSGLSDRQRSANCRSWRGPADRPRSFESPSRRRDRLSWPGKAPLENLGTLGEAEPHIAGTAGGRHHDG